MFKVFLILISILCLNTSFFAVAHDIGYPGTAEMSEIKAYYSTHLFTAEEITDSYYKGFDAGATHMLIVWDTFDFEDSYDFVVYSYPEQDVNEQLSERNGYSWHTEYSDSVESQKRVMNHKHYSVPTNKKIKVS